MSSKQLVLIKKKHEFTISCSTAPLTAQWQVLRKDRFQERNTPSVSLVVLYHKQTERVASLLQSISSCR